MNEVRFTIFGEPASKANSRRLVSFGGKPRIIKSDKARNYVEAFRMQCPRHDPLLAGDLEVIMRIHYASRRPDLDESVILDAMQGFVYQNDRQVKRKLIEWALDKDNPRSEIVVRSLPPVEDILSHIWPPVYGA